MGDIGLFIDAHPFAAPFVFLAVLAVGYVLGLLTKRRIDPHPTRDLKFEALGQVIEYVPDAIVVVDDRGVISLANEPAALLLGYARDDLLAGLGIEKLVPLRLRQAHVGYRAKYALRPERRPMGLLREALVGADIRAVRACGEEIPVSISLCPLEFMAGKFTLAAIRHREADKPAALVPVDIPDGA